MNAFYDKSVLFNPQDRLSEYILPRILVFNNIVKDLLIDI